MFTRFARLIPPRPQQQRNYMVAVGISRSSSSSNSSRMLLAPSGRTAKTATGCGCEQQQTAAAIAKQPLPASGSEAGRWCGSSSSRRRRGCGTRALVELLAAALLVQFAAIAGGGSWLLLRLSALEARHEQTRASCCGGGAVTAAPALLPGNEYSEALASGGGAAAAYVDAVGDIKFGHKEQQGDSWSRFAWKRSAGGDGSGAEGAATANPATEAAAAAEQLADESGQHGIAHFVFRNPRDDEFQLDASLSRSENFTIKVPRPSVPTELRNDRWYPLVHRYLAAYGRLVFLARAPWLDEWNADSTARANSFGEITVSQEGLYMIYAQVCFTNKVPQVMGFVIKKSTVPVTGSDAERGGGSGHTEQPRHQYIAACETYASGGAQPESAQRRFTCPVSTMHHLTPRDRLSIELLSARLLYVRHDFTYVGLVRMA